MKIAIIYKDQYSTAGKYTQAVDIEGPQDVEVIGKLAYRQKFNADDECVSIETTMQWTITIKKMPIFVGWEQPKIKVLTE